MKCQEVLIEIDRIFDQDDSLTVAAEISDHLATCPNCRKYFQQLEKLNEQIFNISGIRPDEKIVRENSDAVLIKTKQPNRFHFTFQRVIGIAAAAILLFAIISFWPGSKKSNQVNHQTNEITIYSAEIESRQAGTILFSSGDQNLPLIVWLYEN